MDRKRHRRYSQRRPSAGDHVVVTIVIDVAVVIGSDSEIFFCNCHSS